MISLDTNQLHGRAPDGPLIRMLQKVAEHAGHELVLPEIVVEEYLAHYRHDVEVAAKKAAGDIDALRRLVPSWHVVPPSFGSVAEMAEHSRRDKVEQIFRILPTPAGAWQEALLREARRRPPAKTSWDDPGSGARDVVIWLTAVDACRASTAEMYFVTANSSDFGKEGSLSPELAQDLDDQLGKDAALLRYCADISVLMEQLGIAGAQPPNDSAIGCAAPVRKAVEAALTDNQTFFEFMPAIPDLASKYVAAYEGLQDLHFERLQGKVEAYRIGASIWACARGKWAGWKDFTVSWRPEIVPSAKSHTVRVDFTVNTTAVMQLDQDGAIVDAEVTDRSRLAIVEVQGLGGT